MLIDSTRLMYWTFAYGRTSVPPTEVLIPLLPAVVGLTNEAGTLAIHLPKAIEQVVPSHIQGHIKIGLLRAHLGKYRITPENAPFFRLASAGIDELKRLWECDEQAATRSLCYALHNVPDFFRQPETFDRALYEHCVLVAGQHWALLAEPLRAQVTAIMGWTTGQTVTFLIKQGAYTEETL
jgi:hypothetical protein